MTRRHSSNWKGGRITAPDCIKLYLPGHPRANSQGYVREHIVVAERAFGKALPLTAVIHHVDRDFYNNANRNLVVCEDHAYHRLLHERMRVREAGGRPGRDFICCHCRQLLPIEAFYTMRTGARTSSCKSCARRIALERYHQRRRTTASAMPSKGAAA